MKKLLFALLFVSIGAMSQGTSQKEYNYLLKGYKDDLAMGKDIISGYTITPIETETTKTSEQGKIISRTTVIYKLTRVANNSIAGFLFEEKRLDTKYENYICIPNSSADISIWVQAQESFFKKASVYKCEQVGQAFSYNWNYLRIMSKLLSN